MENVSERTNRISGKLSTQIFVSLLLLLLFCVVFMAFCVFLDKTFQFVICLIPLIAF